MVDPFEHDDRHRRPEGADDATVEAVGKVSEAVEWLEPARGRLFDFRLMLGHLDFQMGDAVEMLRKAGHEELAELLDEEVVGRNVFEAELEERRRTEGVLGHEARPPAAHHPDVVTDA